MIRYCSFKHFQISGNLRLHCAFQPVDNPGNSAVLLPVDPAAGNRYTFRNHEDVVYSHCSHPETKELATILLVRDKESLYFKAIRYLQDYKYYAASQCKDASGYSDLLPEKSSKASRSKPTSAFKPSPEELAKESGSTPSSAVKPPPNIRKKASVPKRFNKKAHKKLKQVQKRLILLSKNRKSRDAGIYTAAKVKDKPEIDNKFFDEVACPLQELFEPSDEASYHNQEAESSDPE